MELQNIAKLAFDAMATAKTTGSRGGCGRVYVELSDENYKSIRKGSKVAKVFEKAGFKMFPRPGYTGVRIYIGYDNATGLEYAKGEKVVEILKANGLADHGLKCSVDGDGD
jgi:hypothetical protein